ncbi:MAG: C25 family cysteine peptidase [Thermoanaerobaculia bacterium]
MRGSRTPEGLLLEWETTSEAGTVAFSVERRERGEWRAVGRPLAALADAPQGGVYRVLDAQAPGRGAIDYRLVEVESSGKRRIHGPFTVRSEAGAVDAALPIRRARTAPGAGVSAGRNPARAGAPASVNALDVSVAGRGVVRLGAAELAAAAGVPSAAMEERLASYELSIRRGGEEVPYLAADDGSEALVFVPGIDSLYTAQDVLQIDLAAPGLAMGRWTSRPGAPSPGGDFTSHVDFEEDVFPATAATRETDVDHWYWQGFAAGDPELGSHTFALDTPDVVPGGTAQLTIRATGAVVGPADLDHAARVLVGGVEVGVTEWADLERHEATFPVDASLLGASTTVTVEALDDAPERLSMFYLDGFALDYSRAYRAEAGALELAAEGGEQITVEHFASSDVLAFDVTDPARPLFMHDAAVDAAAGEHRLTFNPRAPGTVYVVVERDALLAPSRVEPVGAARIDTTPGAEYVVLTTADMLPAAEALAAYRESTGLTALAVDVREIYDRFRGGRPDPWAIRDFVRWASESWSVAPRYLVLAGAGSLDPRDLLGYGKNRLTPVLLGTAHGLAAADSLLVEPEEGPVRVAVGRLPVRDAAELNAYVAKLQAFESAGAGPGGFALAVADDPDGAGDFPTQSTAAAGHLPATLDVQSIDLARSPVDEAREALFDAWSASPFLVNWVGHGGVDRWAAEPLLTAADVPALGPVGAPPIVSAWTCVIGRFELPAFESLGEALVLEPGGGGVAVLAPSGVSASGQAHVLNRLLFDALDENERLGDAWLSALEGFAAAGGDGRLARVYGLLGDPALRVD